MIWRCWCCPAHPHNTAAGHDRHCNPGATTYPDTRSTGHLDTVCAGVLRLCVSQTAYAKLAAVVPRSALLQHGLYVFPDIHPARSAVIVHPRQRHDCWHYCQSETRVILLQVSHYIFSTCSGLAATSCVAVFFSWDVLCCVILLLRTPMPTTPAWRVLKRTRCLLATIAMLAGTALWAPPWPTPIVWGTPSFGAGFSTRHHTGASFLFPFYITGTLPEKRGCHPE